MKTILPLLFAVLAGVAVGLWGTFREFTGEELPTKAVLLIMSEQENSTQSSVEPKLVVEGGESHDFGHMDVGSKGSHRFVLRNDGQEPLVITKGDSTCKCTTSSAEGGEWKKNEKRTIPTGKTLTVVVDWTIKPQQSQEFSQTAAFYSNDPRRHEFRLSIQGKASQAVEFEQTELLFSNISATDRAVSELRMFGFRPGSLAIEKYEWLNAEHKENYSVSFESLTPEEVARQPRAISGLKMIVEVKPGLPIGPHQQRIRLTTNYAEMEPFEVPVNVSVVGDISLVGAGVIDGRGVSLGSVERAVGKKLTVFLLVKGAHRLKTDFEIEKMVPAGAFQARLEEPDPTITTVKRIPLTIEIPPNSPLLNLTGIDGGERGKIHLKTTDPSIPTFVIDVAFLVRD